MRQTKETAGKTAKGKWRETTRKGKKVIIDPDGRIYHGTPEEVRDAVLVPWRRSALAESLRFALYLRRSGIIDAAEFSEMCADRRSNIMFGAHNESASVSIPADVFLQLQAGARLVGFDSIDDYFADLWRGALEIILDLAQTETGKREIPLTRHEQSALERIRGKQCERASTSWRFPTGGLSAKTPTTGFPKCRALRGQHACPWARHTGLASVSAGSDGGATPAASHG